MGFWCDWSETRTDAMQECLDKIAEREREGVEGEREGLRVALLIIQEKIDHDEDDGG